MLIRPRTLPLLALAAALVSSGPADAGFPGGFTANQVQQFQLRMVCVDDNATQCLTFDSNGFLDGSECPAPVPTPPCEPDYVGGEIRGLLTVIGDDTDPNVNDPDVRVSLVFDFKIGDTPRVIAETFPEGINIADWFPIFDEDDVFSFNLAGGALLNRSLTDLGDKLEAIGQAELGVPAGAQAVIAEGILISTPSATATDYVKKPDEDASASTDPTASVARYRITVRFVPPRGAP